MTRPNNEFDRIMELSNKILDEMAHRNEVDKEIDGLLAENKHEEVQQLLASLDNTIEELRKERDRLLHHTKGTEGQEVEAKEQAITENPVETGTFNKENTSRRLQKYQKGFEKLTISKN